MSVIRDRTAGLTASTRVLELGSFSAAAAVLGTTPSAVSKSVSRLERRLGARLLRRSTRSVVPTDEGMAYYERVAPHLQAIEEAEDVTQAARRPRGLLRVSAPPDFGRARIAPWAYEFLQDYPEMELELSVTDRFVDLVRDGIDLAIRVGDLQDTGLIARRLGMLPFVICAAPGYLRKQRAPRAVEDLSRHTCLRYLSSGRALPWAFGDGRVHSPAGPFSSDDGGTLREAALSGLGLARLFRFHVERDLADGRLVALLEDVPMPEVPLHAVHAFNRQLPARARVFLDGLAVQLSTDPADRSRRGPKARR